LFYVFPLQRLNYGDRDLGVAFRGFGLVVDSSTDMGILRTPITVVLAMIIGTVEASGPSTEIN
jgi:hypothetical protein